ncbi:MAG: CHAT domain-containing protein [Blastocatellia bacterium]
MYTISVHERGGETDSPNAAVSVNGEGEYPITVRNPFSQREEARLEWYFEQRLRFPFTEQVEAQAAAASVAAYGESLFNQVFADRKAYARYQEALQSGVENLRFEIAGSPEFHQLHWESLKDPELPQPLTLQAPMIRRTPKTQTIAAAAQSLPTINLLLVVARPDEGRDVGYRTISRPLVEMLRQSDLRVQVDFVRPGTYQQLVKYLEDAREKHGAGYYHVVHFDAHGLVCKYEELMEAGAQAERLLYQNRFGRGDIEPYEGQRAFIFLEGEKDGQADPVEAGELADLLVTHRAPIVVLNACQSGKQVAGKQVAGKQVAGAQAGASEASLGSRLLQSGAQMVLAMGYSVTVTAAELLMRRLYERLFAGSDLPNAIRRARQELYNSKGRRAYFDQTVELEDWILPVVYQNREQKLAVREFKPDEEAAYYARKAVSYKSQEPAYGFIGRDLDILRIEKKLLGRNLLLLRGMGGAGKTTLLRHLAAWWQTTNFVDRVFYFGYDERAWSRQQILDEIARGLLTPVEFAAFQPLGLDAQQAKLAERLRARRHLLILDNLESITGAQLAIQNTLPPREQTALRGLLADLAGGKTLALLGSRGGEEWLRQGTFNDNIHDLPGLDPEAASLMAERILEKHKAAQYRKDKDFKRLLDLLAGYPLALEVVLANLARQTPAQALAALQSGDVRLDRGDAQSKTESILRCIDYSHGNLSPEAQGLLFCLAPFSLVIFEGAMEQYIAQLNEQPALAHLPFDRWAEVLREAVNWGLISPDPDVPGYLRLQPIFPYFLRAHLNAPEKAGLRSAVETAFQRHYDEVGGAIRGLLLSKDPNEKQLGQALARLEYENLVTALNLTLGAQESILNTAYTLSLYLDATQDHRRGLEMGEMILAGVEKYTSEKLDGKLGGEFAAVIDNIAKHQLLLKQYASSEASYQKALSILLGNKGFEASQIKNMSASIYHQLGIVAQEQRQWAQAEQYYKEALAIKVEFQDRYSQARTYHQLGRVAREQRQWAQARDYFLKALDTFAEFQDQHSLAIVLRSLALLWRESGDGSLPAVVASRLGVATDEMESSWRKMLEEQ